MTDALERGGAMASVYRTMKTKDNGYMRIDKNKVLSESKKMSTAKGEGRNKIMSNSIGGSSKKKT